MGFFEVFSSQSSTLWHFAPFLFRRAHADAEQSGTKIVRNSKSILLSKIVPKKGRTGHWIILYVPITQNSKLRDLRDMCGLRDLTGPLLTELNGYFIVKTFQQNDYRT
jgi:hypothetical protein